MHDIVLDVQNVKKYFPVTAGAFKRTVGQLKAVDNVSFQVKRGETLGIVGESGCGKTTLGKCIVRLHNLTDGHMILNCDGEMVDMTTLKGKDSLRARRRVQMVFQDPYASLNPMKNILTAFDEPLKVHGFGTAEQRKEIIANMLQTVNLQPDYMYRFPHEFSGGQRQRICIAKSLALQPEIIVCDEPVSALDVSIQAQMMNLMKELQQEFHLTYLFIAHDLSVVQYMSDRIAVMYLGKIVELADADSLADNRLHPYTQALYSAVPIPIPGAKKDRAVLSGDVPSPIKLPKGCRFHPRCPHCTERCAQIEPELKAIPGKDGHYVACHLYDNTSDL